MKGPLQILVVDDDMVSRRYISRMLTKRMPHWRVMEADSGAAALAALDRNRIDVVITDLSMPFDGFRLSWLLLVKPEYRHVRTIVVTTLDAAEIRRRDGLPPGVPLMGKPPSIASLVRLLEEMQQGLADGRS